MNDIETVKKAETRKAQKERLKAYVEKMAILKETKVEGRKNVK